MKWLRMRSNYLIIWNDYVWEVKWLRMRSNYLIMKWNEYLLICILMSSICLIMWNDYVWEVIT